MNTKYLKALTIVTTCLFSLSTYATTALIICSVQAEPWNQVVFFQANHEKKYELEPGWRFVQYSADSSDIGSCSLNYSTMESYPVKHSLSEMNCIDQNEESTTKRSLVYSEESEKWVDISINIKTEEYLQKLKQDALEYNFETPKRETKIIKEYDRCNFKTIY